MEAMDKWVTRDARSLRAQCTQATCRSSFTALVWPYKRLQHALRVCRTYTAAEPAWGRRWCNSRLMPLRAWCDGVHIVIRSMILPAAGGVNTGGYSEMDGAC